MLRRLRGELEAIRAKKHKYFDDFHPLIQKIAKTYAFLFPNFSENKKGSHHVYNFGIEGFYPFTVVKDHGHNEHQSPKAAKKVIASIEDILDYIESRIPDDQDAIPEGSGDNEGDNDRGEETGGVLPEPKIPDGDR